jgi:hypothetical protein
VKLYVAFRTSKPNNKIVKEVLQKLQENNIDVSQLVLWPATNCQWSEDDYDDDDDDDDDECSDQEVKSNLMRF